MRNNKFNSIFIPMLVSSILVGVANSLAQNDGFEKFVLRLILNGLGSLILSAIFYRMIR